MRNRILLLITFLMAFAIATPTFAAPVEDAATTSIEAEAPEVKAPEPEAKAPEVKAAPTEAVKPVEIKSDEEAAGVTRQLLDAARGGKWGAVAAFAIMLLVFVVNKVPAIKLKLGSKATPWLAAGTGIASYIAAALLVDNTTIIDAISGGFMTGAGAVGLWELLFKHLLKPAATPAAPSV